MTRGKEKLQDPTNIFVQKSPVHGWGVFAKKDFSEDELVEECPYVPLPEDFKEVSKALRPYIFNVFQPHVEGLKEVGTRRPAVLLGYGAIYNHNIPPNITFKQVDDHFVFRTCREVSSGEELFSDYGDFYSYEGFERGDNLTEKERLKKRFLTSIFPNEQKLLRKLYSFLD